MYVTSNARGVKEKSLLPGVFAFEIETNLRGVLEEILEPIVRINVENNKRLLNMEHTTRAINKVNTDIYQKLREDRKLKDMIDDCNTLCNRIKYEIHRELDQFRQRQADLNQLVNVHEDKLIRLVDDRTLFELSKNQMRKDIHNFEVLCQDISIQNKNECYRMQDLMFKENKKLEHLMDDMKDDQSR